MIKLAISLSGWFLLGSYLSYEYQEYGSDFFRHLYSPEHSSQSVFHIAMFLVPLLTTSLGYLLHQKDKLLEKVASEKTKEDAILGAIEEGISIQDTSFKILYQNQLHKEMMGSHVGEYCYKAFQNREEVCNECHLAMSFRDGKTHRKERKVVTDEGTVYLEIASSPLTDSSGNIVAGVDVLRDVTERREREELLRESEQKFRTLFESATDAIFILDLEGNFIDINRSAHERLGYTREEMLSMHIAQLDPPEFAKMVPERMKQIMTHGKAVFESSHVRKDGTVMPVEVNTRIIDYGGRRVVFSIVRDITERKKAEESLKESEAVYHNLFNNSEIAMFRTRLDGSEVLNVNDKFLELVGQTSEEIIGKPSVIHWVDPSRREEMVRILKANGRVVDFEFQMLDKKRGVRDCLTSLNLYPEEGILNGSIVDITERKRAEKELREKEGKYRVLFESANDGIFIHDETGFVDCNEKGAQMYGLPKDEIIGRSPGEFAPQRQPDGRLSSEVANEKIRAALSGVPQVFEWQPVRADGSPFDVEITLSRLELGGKMVLQAIVRDIGERKLLEQEMLKTEKLESLGTLAGGIAHDFNNLLQGVFGYISMAKLTHDQKEKSLAMLEEAEEALHQSVNLTTQLLTFSRGGRPIKKKMKLQPVIESTTKFALSGSGVEYRMEFGSGLWAVEADEGQISQVVQNVVINADQAMPEGGTLVVAARNVVGPDKNHPKIPHGKYVEISVRDSGIGIAGQYLQKIFDPYFTTKERGSGLGLATAYSIVKNHNGLIDVISELGRGTTFFIYLPAVEGEDEIAETPPASSTVKKGKILVMDDEERIRTVAGELIMALGHEVALTEDGQAAIETYQSAMKSDKPFDMVILDLTVRGGMGGKETLERLRVIDPGVNAIVSSGYSDDAVVADHERYGFKARLTKPYKLEGLRDTLNALLSS